MSYRVDALAAYSFDDSSSSEDDSPTNSPYGRRRSLSSSSSTSWSQESSTGFFGNTPLESDDVRDLFTTLKNRCVKSPPSTFELTFDGLNSTAQNGSRGQKNRKRSLTLDDQLNPTAVPFVPSGTPTLQSPPIYPTPESHEAQFNENPFEVISMHSPQKAGGRYMRPPGLPVPTARCASPTTIPAGHTTPSIQHDSLNPHTQTSTPAPHPNRNQSAPSWYSSFCAGTNPAIDVQIREFNAHAAVASNPNWTEDEMGLFATQFASQAYFATETPEETIAEFAVSVFKAFEATQGVICAQSFLWSLRQHALHAFMTSWDMASLDPTLHHSSGLSQHVIGSISIARFIGDLFKHGLLAKTHVENCIARILENPSAEEHIVSLGYLVVRSGPDFWMSGGPLSMQLNTGEFEDFCNKFEALASSVRYSLVGGEPGYSAVWVGEVKIRFAEWKAYYSACGNSLGRSR